MVTVKNGGRDCFNFGLDLFAKLFCTTRLQWDEIGRPASWNYADCPNKTTTTSTINPNEQTTVALATSRSESVGLKCFKPLSLHIRDDVLCGKRCNNSVLSETTSGRAGPCFFFFKMTKTQARRGSTSRQRKKRPSLVSCKPGTMQHEARVMPWTTPILVACTHTTYNTSTIKRNNRDGSNSMVVALDVGTAAACDCDCDCECEWERNGTRFRGPDVPAGVKPHVFGAHDHPWVLQAFARAEQLSEEAGKQRGTIEQALYTAKPGSTAC